jgi:LysM repeat protein
MEVLVLFVTSRKVWARLTRAMVVVLLAVLLAGVFVYFQNNKPKAANAGSQPPAPSNAPAGPTPVIAVGSGPVSPAPPGGPGVATLQPLPPVGGKPTPPPASTDSAKQAAARLVATAPISTTPIAASDADKLLADAKAKLEAGDPVAVRNLLNDAIVGERLPAALLDQARAMQARVNEKLVFSPQPFPGDTYSETAKIEGASSLRTIARQHAIPWEALCRINGVSDKRIRAGQQLKAPVGPFHVMVTKKDFRLDLFLGGLPGEAGSLYVTSLAVGLGKDNSTPTGLWEVSNKVRNPPWTKPHSNEHFEGYDPKNPLGGYWIALKGIEGSAVGQSGYGIHGTIDPDSIGKQASMGCVRLKVEDVQVVFDLLTDKSRVLVRD